MPGSKLHLLPAQQSRAACPTSLSHTGKGSGDPAGLGQFWAGDTGQELTERTVSCASSGSLVLRGCRTLVLGSIAAAFNVIDWAARGGWRLQAKQNQVCLG